MLKGGKGRSDMCTRGSRSSYRIVVSVAHAFVMAAFGGNRTFGLPAVLDGP